jgi:hypothetical protein
MGRGPVARQARGVPRFLLDRHGMRRVAMITDTLRPGQGRRVLRDIVVIVTIQ